MNKLNVLYEDNHIIVVVKPYNVLSQGDSTGDTSIMDKVKEYIKVKYHKPGLHVQSLHVDVFSLLLHHVGLVADDDVYVVTDSQCQYQIPPLLHDL